MSQGRTFFKFFPVEFWADDKVEQMTWAATGCYLKLLSHQWLYGSVPKGGALKRLLKGPRKWSELWAQLEPCFVDDPESEGLVNPRLKKEYNAMLAASKRERDRWHARNSTPHSGGVDLVLGVESAIDVPDEEDVRGTSSLKSLAARVRAGEFDEPESEEPEVDFKNLIWEKEEDALYCARRIIQERGRTSVFMARLIVRNALDCWARRKGKKKLLNPSQVLQKRARQGKEILLRSGDRFDDRAAEAVKGWLEVGALA